MTPQHINTLVSDSMARRPLRERQVRPHDDCRPLGPLGDHLKQKLRSDVSQRNVPHFIDRDQLVSLPSRHQAPHFVILLRFRRLVHQCCGRCEPDSPLLPACRQAQARRQVSFPRSART